jgi:hypothetical protein
VAPKSDNFVWLINKTTNHRTESGHDWFGNYVKVLVAVQTKSQLQKLNQKFGGLT